MEINRIIFLQIQTAKLLAFGIVDQSTSKWQKLPKNFGLNYYEFNFSNRFMQISPAAVEGVLTGNFSKLLEIFHDNFFHILKD